MTLSRMVSAGRCGQKPDCSGLAGEVTFEPGREWQVRNWSASCDPLLDGGEEPEGRGRRRMGGQRRAPRGMEEAWAHSWAALRRKC